MRNPIVVRSIGLFLAVVTSVTFGIWISWNGRIVNDFVGQTGAIVALIGVVIAIAAALLLALWPEKWSSKTAKNVRNILILIAILAAVLVGAEPIRDALANAPWLVLFVLVFGLIWLYIVVSLTILARVPLPSGLRKVFTWIRSKTRKTAKPTQAKPIKNTPAKA